MSGATGRLKTGDGLTRFAFGVDLSADSLEDRMGRGVMQVWRPV